MTKTKINNIFNLLKTCIDRIYLQAGEDHRNLSGLDNNEAEYMVNSVICCAFSFTPVFTRDPQLKHYILFSIPWFAGLFFLIKLITTYKHNNIALKVLAEKIFRAIELKAYLNQIENSLDECMDFVLKADSLEASFKTKIITIPLVFPTETIAAISQTLADPEVVELPQAVENKTFHSRCISKI